MVSVAGYVTSDLRDVWLVSLAMSTWCMVSVAGYVYVVYG